MTRIQVVNSPKSDPVFVIVIKVYSLKFRVILYFLETLIAVVVKQTFGFQMLSKSVLKSDKKDLFFSK